MAEATSGTGLRNIPGRAILYLLASSFLLVVLDTLLATRSVNRAAEKLFLSQPATSLSLRRS